MAQSNIQDIIKFASLPSTNADKIGTLTTTCKHCSPTKINAQVNLIEQNSTATNIITVRAKLIGNIFTFYDEAKLPVGDERHIKCLIIERANVRAIKCSTGMPFPFELSFGDKSPLVFIFGANSEEEMRDWIQVLSEASVEAAVSPPQPYRTADAERPMKNKPRKSVTGVPVELRDPVQVAKNGSKLFLVNWSIVPLTFKVESRYGTQKQEVKCIECMTEFRSNVTLPIAFCENFRHSTTRLRDLFIKRFGYLPQVYQQTISTHIAHLNALIDKYNESAQFMENHAISTTSYFRPSTERTHYKWAFMPINLHLQRFFVHIENAVTPNSQSSEDDENSDDDEQNTEWRYFDHITTGVVSALALKFSDGCTRKMREKLIKDCNGCTDIVDLPALFTRLNELKSIRTELSKLTAVVLDEWPSASNNQSCNNMTDELQSKARSLYESAKSIFGSIAAFTESQNIYYQSSNDRIIELLKSSKCPRSKLIGTGSTKACLTQLQNELDSLLSKLSAACNVDSDTYTLWCQSVSQSANHTLACFDANIDTMQESLLFQILTILPINSIDRYYKYLFRRNICLSMALTTMVNALVGRLFLLGNNDEQDDEVLRAMQAWNSIGAPFVKISHLSCYGDEKHMINEAADTWNSINPLVQMQFTRMISSLQTQCIPIVEGDKSRYHITVPLPESIYERIPASTREKFFSVVSLHINVGINHESFFSNQLGDNQIESVNNRRVVQRMGNYLDSIITYQKNTDSHSNAAIEQAKYTLKQLQAEMSHAERNTNILRLAAQFARNIHAPLIICCKSGKDRTGMAVTLEQARCLRETIGLSSGEQQSVLNTMRTHSVRRENCRKNIKHPLYAISAFQLPFLPQEYRPPPGTHASGQS